MDVSYNIHKLLISVYKFLIDKFLKFNFFYNQRFKTIKQIINTKIIRLF